MNEPRGRWCVFRAGRELCLPAEQVHEIRAWPAVACLPLAPGRVLGLFALGDEAVPVIAVQAGDGDSPEFTHVLIAGRSRARFAIAACGPRLVEQETPPAEVVDTKGMLAEL